LRTTLVGRRPGFLALGKTCRVLEPAISVDPRELPIYQRNQTKYENSNSVYPCDHYYRSYRPHVRFQCARPERQLGDKGVDADGTFVAPRGRAQRSAVCHRRQQRAGHTDRRGLQSDDEHVVERGLVEPDELWRRHRALRRFCRRGERQTLYDGWLD
jgi:hypothetical protein